MDNSNQDNKGCCANNDCCLPSGADNRFQPIFINAPKDDACCGAPPGPASSDFEKPGYQLLNFVDDFISTPVGKVPRVKIKLDRFDLWGTVAVRLGVKRHQYKIAPGLYCVGHPGQDSPILVTANYKLSFDTLRKALTSLDVWILVLDTRGINVWCAAGKALFSTEEVIRRIKQTGLNRVVRHNQLILPQLAATGVSVHRVKKESGFTVLWGPIRAKDLQQFMAAGMKADKPMRLVTFSALERIVLLPVELAHLPKPTLWVLLAGFLLSGIGTRFFSFNDAWTRGLMALSAYAGGILAGAVAAPILLPWIPGRAFALKGMMTGIIAGLTVVFIFKTSLIWPEVIALFLMTLAVSSYLTMNFTGSTPYTSPSGVEKEMRTAIPLQLAALLIAVVAWVGAAFVG
jgi:hypothetical protein